MNACFNTIEPWYNLDHLCNGIVWHVWIPFPATPAPNSMWTFTWIDWECSWMDSKVEHAMGLLPVHMRLPCISWRDYGLAEGLWQPFWWKHLFFTLSSMQKWSNQEGCSEMPHDVIVKMVSWPDEVDHSPTQIFLQTDELPLQIIPPLNLLTCPNSPPPPPIKPTLKKNSLYTKHFPNSAIQDGWCYFSSNTESLLNTLSLTRTPKT